jgi:hypothetical protein
MSEINEEIELKEPLQIIEEEATQIISEIMDNAQEKVNIQNKNISNYVKKQRCIDIDNLTPVEVKFKQVDLIIREAEELAKRIQDEANDIIEEIMNNAHERVYLQNNNIKKDKMTIEELTEIVDDIVITDDDKVSKKRKGTSISVNDYYEDILKKWNQKASEILDLNNIEEEDLNSDNWSRSLNNAVLDESLDSTIWDNEKNPWATRSTCENVFECNDDYIPTRHTYEQNEDLISYYNPEEDNKIDSEVNNIILTDEEIAKEIAKVFYPSDSEEEK